MKAGREGGGDLASKQHLDNNTDGTGKRNTKTTNPKTRARVGRPAMVVKRSVKLSSMVDGLEGALAITAMGK